MVGLVNVRFDFNTVVQEAVAAHRHAATVKSLKLVLTADPVRVGQIMTALVSNAVQFTESGEVRVGLSLESASPSSRSPGTWPMYMWKSEIPGSGSRSIDSLSFSSHLPRWMRHIPASMMELGWACPSLSG